MFEDFSDYKSQLIYLGLKSLIETKSGHDLHNAEGGNPVYVVGSKGKIFPELNNADSPERSALYQMLSELSKKLKDSGIESHQYNWWYDFSSWQAYCQFIVKSYGVKAKL